MKRPDPGMGNRLLHEPGQPAKMLAAIQPNISGSEQWHQACVVTPVVPAAFCLCVEVEATEFTTELLTCTSRWIPATYSCSSTTCVLRHCCARTGCDRCCRFRPEHHAGTATPDFLGPLLALGLREVFQQKGDPREKLAGNGHGFPLLIHHQQLPIGMAGLQQGDQVEAHQAGPPGQKHLHG